MNRLIIFIIGLLAASPAYSQATGTDVPQDPERGQNIAFWGTTATVKKATRLFKDKDDLTSVIMVLPSGSVVDVVSSDTAFIKVGYEGNTGFIYSRHAYINRVPVSEARPEPASAIRGVEKTRVGRYEYLENKYGRSVAERIYSGKIWKGMRAEMVKDSWGSPGKINKIISNSMVREEWYYKNTVLFFQNNTLVKWGSDRD